MSEQETFLTDDGEVVYHLCRTCRGNGSIDGERCPTCEGSGRVPFDPNDLSSIPF